MEWRFGMTDGCKEIGFDLSFRNGRHIAMLADLKGGEKIKVLADLTALPMVIYADDDINRLKAIAQEYPDQLNVFAKAFNSFDFKHFKEHWLDDWERDEFELEMPDGVMEIVTGEKQERKIARYIGEDFFNLKRGGYYFLQENDKNSSYLYDGVKSYLVPNAYIALR